MADYQRLFKRADLSHDYIVTEAEINDAEKKGAISKEESAFLKDVYDLQKLDNYNFPIEPDTMWECEFLNAVGILRYAELTRERQEKRDASGKLISAPLPPLPESFAKRHMPPYMVGDSPIIKNYLEAQALIEGRRQAYDRIRVMTLKGSDLLVFSDEEKKNPYFLKWAVGVNYKAYYYLKCASPEVKARVKNIESQITKFNIEFTERFKSTADLEQILKNREDFEKNPVPDPRPVALVVYPKYDDSGAFTQNNLDELIKRYNVIYIEADTDRAFWEAVRNTGRKKPIDLLVIGGHGNQYLCDFNKPPSQVKSEASRFYEFFDFVKLAVAVPVVFPAMLAMQTVNFLSLGSLKIGLPSFRPSKTDEVAFLDVSDMPILIGLSSYLSKDSAIVLDSCSTGKGKDWDPKSNLANVLSAAFKNSRIYAPTRPTAAIWQKYEFDDKGRFRNVSFSDYPLIPLIGIPLDYQIFRKDITYKIDACPEYADSKI